MRCPVRKMLDLPEDAGDDVVARHVATLQADNNYLRAVVEYMADERSPQDRIEMRKRVLESTPHNTMRDLEQEFHALRRDKMTPTMESIIQAVHDAAGKGDEGDDVVVTLSSVEYEALCFEEGVKEAELEDSPVDDGSSPDGHADDECSRQVDD